jgi:acyl-CoA synthetase (AMP-forming)/AMP-acid ligase II
MLYECWQQIARERHAELALHDLATGERWTFAQLDAARPTRPLPADGLVCPQGNRAAFILEVLQAWRTGRVLCPHEPAQPSPAPPPPPPGIVQLKTTSATTGNARLIAFTGPQLAADAAQIVRTMGLRPDWPNLGAISLAHSYGYSSLVLPLLLHGIPLFLLESTLPEAVRRSAALAPELTLAAVPALWRAWHEAGAIPSNVRVAISAGAPLPLALEASIFAATGLKLHNFYGASECGGIAYDASDIPRTDPACVGSAMEGVRLGVSADGCLEVRSPAVAECYWPAAEGSLGQGRFRTTDLAELSAGRVHLRGRAGDQINVAGRKVAPETVERELQQHSLVGDCLVFGASAPGQERSEMIVACVVAKSALASDELRHFLLARLPAWQVPREWRFVDSLAPNARGKLSRAQWRMRLGFSEAGNGTAGVEARAKTGPAA